MPSTVYKGDLVEASFGHESGVKLTHDFGGTFRFHAYDTDVSTAEGTDYTTLFFSGGTATSPCNAGILAFPIGMLVGSQLVFNGLTQTNDGTETTFDKANNASEGKVFTIIEHTHDSGNNRTQLRIHPPLTNQSNNNSNMTSAAGSVEILPYKTPTFDLNNSVQTLAQNSAERVLTDQFVGIVNTITLPETKVDLKRFHVVGLGRDVAIQTPGRFLNQGGSFEANLHNSRWLYYCLGNEVVALDGQGGGDGDDFQLNANVAAGDSYLELKGSNDEPEVPGGTPLAAGDYILIQDTNTVDLNIHMGAAGAGTWPANFTTDGNKNSVLNTATKEEVRRVAAINDGGSLMQIWLDDPLNFSHLVNTHVDFIKYEADGTRNSPHLDPTTKSLSNPVKKLLFSKSTVPSFAMEVSIRRNDAEGTASDVVDGGASDTKQLTRVFRGCKVKDFSITADTDAALRLTTNFDAALCYTDTGRLETSNPGDRYDAHRLFEDVTGNNAAQLKKRKEMGLAKGTQKPFMFYNGTIKVKGVTLGQVVSFTLNGKTGVEQHYTINGVTTGDSKTDQVPFAGTRNASVAVEGKTEYDMEMEIIVDDPVFYHSVRRSLQGFDDDTSDTTDADVITLSFTKQGSGADRESLDIIMDDYFITEAPLPIPEDKGPIKSMLKIMPKSVKVVAQETVLHA